MDRFEAMRSFVQVVESGSFTRAALLLGRSKTTVSDQVSSLEANLGVSLLTRTTRTVVPTPDGLQYVRRASAILTQLEEAETALKARTLNPQGVLKVEMPSVLGQLLVVPQLQSFLDRYPRISLDLSCTDRSSDLIREGVDCVVRGGVLPDSSLVCRKLADIEFSLFASPSYLIRHGSPQQPGDLRQHQLIGYRNASANGVLEIALNRGDERVDVKMPMRLTVSDVVTTLQAGLAGLGIIYSSNFTVAQHLRTGSMVRILPDWQGRKMPLTLLSPSNRFRTARVQVFMDWVQELLRKNLPAS